MTFPKKLNNIKTSGTKLTISCKTPQAPTQSQNFRQRSQSSLLQLNSFWQSWSRCTFPCSDSMGTRQLSLTPDQSFSILHGNRLFSWCLEERTTPNHPQAQPPWQNQLQVSTPNHPTPHHRERLWKSSSRKIPFPLPRPETNGSMTPNLALEPTTAPIWPC